MKELSAIFNGGEELKYLIENFSPDSENKNIALNKLKECLEFSKKSFEVNKNG